MKTSYFAYELKKWLRDPMMSFMLVFPVFLALIVRLGVPYAEEQYRFSLEPQYHVFIAALMLMTAAITGGIIGFSILDDRDDKILYAVDVSPVSLHMFLGFRFAMSFVLTYISCILVMLVANLAEVPPYAMLLVPVSISLFASVSAMFVNFFSTNKVEGFAMMKAAGMIIIFPVVSLFFTDFKEFFFGFEPNFWAVKALGAAMLPAAGFNLGFFGYYSVGLIYVIVLNAVFYKIFRKRML